MPRNDSPLPRGRARRTMPLAGFTARAAGGRLVAGLRETTGPAGTLDGFHERAAERYAELLGHSKGVLMKAGQIFATVDPGAIGNGEVSPYQRALSGLQTDTPPMDPGLAKDLLEAYLARPAAEVFAEFADEPMATTSIGQIHHAVLHDGREVAVKIQYPGAAEAIRDDLANTELLTAFFRFLSSAARTSIPETQEATREIAKRIAEEIDYRHEAANISAFSQLYRDHPFIRIPEVIHDASGEWVLTMTYLDGLDWPAAQHAEQDLKNTWAEVIWRFSMGSYSHANLLHADAHPGNYRFGLDGHVGFVGFGCAKVLPERSRRSFVEQSRAFVDGRKNDLRDCMIETGFLSTDSTLTVDETWKWYADLMYEWIAPQPVTFTRDAPARVARGAPDVRSPEPPVRRMLLAGDSAFFSRITLNLSAICAQLGATVHLRSLLDDLSGVGEPTTSVGKQHVAWVRRRGLPYGLEPHDLS